MRTLSASLAVTASLLLSLVAGAQAQEQKQGRATAAHAGASKAATAKRKGRAARAARRAAARLRRGKSAPAAIPAPPLPDTAAPASAPNSAPTPEPAPPSESEPAPAPSSTSAPTPLLDTGFEGGLAGWSTAGVGEVMPSVVGDIVRSGSRAAKFVLSGSQHRSELILGGDGSGDTSGAARFSEGDEYWYGFSFYIESMVYGRPGAHNLIMQFKSADSGSPAFGLALWDYQGNRGLWSHGSGMGGDRYLAAAPERQWHDVVIHFKASSIGEGFYEVYLDGSLIDSRSGASMIVSGAGNAYIKDGLYRNGGKIPGTSEIRLDAARLGASFDSVAVS